MKRYDVTGMSCAACSSRVEKAVSQVEGVTSCSVSLLTNSMGVEGSAAPEQVIAAVENAGYGASLSGEKKTESTADNDAAGQAAVQKLRSRLTASLGFLLCLMYLSMGHMMWGWRLPSFLSGNPLALGLCQLLLAAVIMVINQKFFISGFQSLLRKSPNMDTLVALGASAAFGYSTYALFAMTDAAVQGMPLMPYMEKMYFESAGMILTLITVGKMLEARAKGKTTSALKSLISMKPRTAVILRDEKEITVPVSELSVGDVFVVRPGEKIPADGVVLEGESAVNESALTGESIPADKLPGDTVSAATTNQSGYLKCRTLRVGEDTTLSQIIRMVTDAAATKAPIAKAADKVAGVFVPVVMGIAAMTILVWLLCGAEAGTAIARGIAVLVISCPCALGLATPVAIMVGSGKGAKNGILFKNSASMEMTGRAKIVVLDKTGTITKGEPQVTDILPAEGISAQTLSRMAAALEKHSEHPLAKAVLQSAGEIQLPEVTKFEAHTGNGLTAEWNGETLAGGNYGFISRYAEIPEAVRIRAEALAEEGKTPLFFAGGGKLLGILAVMDVVKQDSPQAIAELKKMGLRVVMLTGDHERTARAIGTAVGVDEVIAGVLPDGKEAVVRKLSQEGKTIMVGDGINDAPALMRADVGMAIGAGTDTAIDAASVVLMKSRLTDVADAVKLGRAVLRNIHENLFWAFFYNIIGIPLAAGVWIPVNGWELSPMFGAAAMSLSSFCVVSNALRLNLLKLHQNEPTAEKTAIQQPGREVNAMTKTIRIEGMMCGHCEATVKKALEALETVSLAQVSHTEGTAIVTLTGETEDAVLRKTVEEKDFTVLDIQ